jgi:hypothetical protein
MHFSQFTSHFLANVRSMAPAVAADIRRAALARVTERQRAGRADGALLFDDLIERIERAVAGGSAIA